MLKLFHKVFRSQEQENSYPSYFDYLPKDVTLYLLTFVDVKELGICAQISHDFQKWSEDDIVWKHKMKEILRDDSEWKELESAKKTWKERYKLYLSTTMQYYDINFDSKLVLG
jgi:hypothetical protein